MARLKHLLRRAAIVAQRVREGEIELAHVPDAANVVDIFTKWSKAEKIEKCLAYLTNAAARAAHGDAPYAPTTSGGHVALALLATWMAHDLLEEE